MKILTGTQIKEADRYTIENEPISSVDLMERASNAIAQWINNNIDKQQPLFFIIGKGNNGGDGLAVARILYHSGYNCSVYLPFDKEQLSEESSYNLKRLPNGVNNKELDNIGTDTIIIDCLMGTGVKGELKEPLASVIDKINSLTNTVISIDLPSGMISEFGNANQKIVKADITLTLEFPKLAMLLPEAGEYCGEIKILPIGLDKEFINNAKTRYNYITEELIENIKLKRSKFGHKGTYGHALLICGSKGMAGAAVLSTGAALRSGCGLVTLHIPESERFAVQATYPSVILSLDSGYQFSELPPNLSAYTSIGIGPGLGQSTETTEALRQTLNTVYNPVVLDADALNIISEHYKLRPKIPAGSILTPHPKELERLIGKWQNEEEKLDNVKRLAANLKSIIVVKGAHTMIYMPDGRCYFNSTGNSGMAKGGSGDVLTGYITGLLARGYKSEHAAILGVYMHGLAGDKAAAKYGLEGMNSRDLIDDLAI
ncbi:bifunctional ADP-dependent NAD(P)H-hydrate dehydratase/NAD(P)H-hydrate epimerase [Prevotella sp. 10(H)]|uniref:bifunctional ADP-dependent NAD(P)H-hydrate dehydratase/NAD(P)H-hydrate epimerase n=1 Tax=Prevotella sp. 10(H) TaxID=1158294 RepID=UPI0004A6DEC8|nr:bifunctional ADP-dependent NAD(P)H-hydrate dehydratase/NAD(P)H-hydrate epimerase [Prevotella sp. 10(H)]